MAKVVQCLVCNSTPGDGKLAILIVESSVFLVNRFSEYTQSLKLSQVPHTDLVAGTCALPGSEVVL